MLLPRPSPLEQPPAFLRSSQVGICSQERDLHYRAARRVGQKAQGCIDRLGPLVHPGNAPMTASRVYFWPGRHATAIIANAYKEVCGLVDDIDSDRISSGMPNGIDDRLEHDSFDLRLHGRAQRSTRARTMDFRLKSKRQIHTAQGQRDRALKRVCRGKWGAQIFHGLTALLCDFAQALRRVAE